MPRLRVKIDLAIFPMFLKSLTLHDAKDVLICTLVCMFFGALGIGLYQYHGFIWAMVGIMSFVLLCWAGAHWNGLLDKELRRRARILKGKD